MYTNRKSMDVKANLSEFHPKYPMLKQIMDTVIPLYDGMPCPKLVIIEYRRFDYKDYNGFWDDPFICILEDYLKDADYYDLVYFIKHELVHAWQTYFGFELSIHDHYFFRKALDINLDVKGTLRRHPDCEWMYKIITEGRFKGMTAEQIWDKANPGVERKVRNGWD